jgi:outer membrane lipoprotein LolB
MSSCRSLPTAEFQQWPARRAELQSIREFAFDGRVALAAGTQGLSAGLHWQQMGDDAALTLRGPLGLGALQIEYDATSLRVTGSDGVQRSGATAEALMHDTLGFAPPLASLRYWLLGCSDPASAAEETLDDTQRLQTLRQQGWQIEYQSYQRVQQRWLPQRVNVQRDERRLKLVIERWRLPT